MTSVTRHIAANPDGRLADNIVYFARALLILALVLVALAPAAAHASENLTHVKNLNYAPANGGTPNYGTDIEFATLNGREYALAGSYNNGMQIVDITDPQTAQIAAVYDCGVSQGDVQVFRQEDLPAVGAEPAPVPTG